MTASSSEEGREPSFATDENIQTWWRAAGNQPGEWISMDLGEVKDVRAVQINFADDKIDAPLPGERQDRKSTRLNSSHMPKSRMPSSA